MWAHYADQFSGMAPDVKSRLLITLGEVDQIQKHVAEWLYEMSRVEHHARTVP
jgi:hypothetical protein